ncbi:uncharacterized protein LOC5565102 isoform X2 [Aedes aegypti]|uniref:Uncharacterized protein n=1 Tax=Aedes aegypti TaxID=7159 RepID=A0A6I8TJ17_AEDAE|nr:uncharacterized protein LOC5565102 isoform X2 [Aedes aegypti]
MKLILVTCILSTLVLSIQCRPQAVQIEQQLMRMLPQQRALEPLIEQRGSIEETQRILQEIDRINIALGYKKKQEVAFPRTSNFNEGYFFPRPVYQPLNFRTTASPTAMFKQFDAPQVVSTVDPFRAQVYYYPAPYMHLPLPDDPRSFEMKKSRDLPVRTSPQIYVLPIAVPAANGKGTEIRYVPSTIDFGTLRSFHGKGRSLNGGDAEEEQSRQGKGVVDDVASVVEDEKIEEELLEEVLEAVDYGLEDDEESKKKKQATTTNPPLQNDKFMNGKFLSGESDEKDDDLEPALQMMILNRGRNRSFNLTATFQNFTNRFNMQSTTSPRTALPSEIKDLKEIPDGSDNDIAGDEKSPFGGLFNRQTEPSSGGLVIQRLRVRQGGIAIAGPGGVATAGSGGTAIVGPNGTAITHPRSLTIAGPGAKIYAVPESVDLGRTINATKRSLPLDAVLVASGPVVYYRD